jgi:hypothetical protein
MKHNKKKKRKKKGILNFLFLCIYFVSFLRILSRLNIGKKKHKLNNKNKYKIFLSFKDKY